MEKIISFLILTLLLFSSCKQEGCSDPRAKNFSYDAQKEDGSCDYSGCTDPDALNYNPDAHGEDGTCTYLGDVKFITTRNAVETNNVFLAVKVSNEFIGNLQNTCLDQFPSCNSGCTHLNFTEKKSGSYAMQFWEIKQISSTNFDTIFTSLPIAFQVIGKQCTVVVIE